CSSKCFFNPSSSVVACTKPRSFKSFKISNYCHTPYIKYKKAPSPVYIRDEALLAVPPLLQYNHCHLVLLTMMPPFLLLFRNQQKKSLQTVIHLQMFTDSHHPSARCKRDLYDYSGLS